MGGGVSFGFNSNIVIGYMSTYSLLLVYSKEDVEEGGKYAISNLLKKIEGELLTIQVVPVLEEVCMFEEGMYLYVLFLGGGG